MNQNGYPPTIREISDHFKFSSPAGALSHIEALQKKGYIERDHASRGIRIIAESPFDISFAEVVGDFFDEGKVISTFNKYNIPVPSKNGSLFAVRSLTDLKRFAILKGDYVIFDGKTLLNGLVFFVAGKDEFVGDFENGLLIDLEGKVIDNFQIHGSFYGIVRIPERKGFK